ncbi:hypothetical protein GGR01_000211 [Acetobacter oeni]|nr:hypothetical protein [Acetobacter oeni]
MHRNMIFRPVSDDQPSVVNQSERQPGHPAQTLATRLVAEPGAPYNFGGHANMQIGTSAGIGT